MEAKVKGWGASASGGHGETTVTETNEYGEQERISLFAKVRTELSHIEDKSNW